jgi:phosphoribosylformylglycinamidine cyclo-ligase
MSDDPLTYEGTGVSLDAAEAVVDRIRAAVISTHGREVLGGHGGFAGLFAPSVGDPLLSAACDGAGTKVLLGHAAKRYSGLGIDTVAMSVNDVITSGGRPAFFLDHITCGRIDPGLVGELVEGVAEGCRIAGCVLLGGETAEHPGMMEPDEFDIAGFCVGVCERTRSSGCRRAARTRTASRSFASCSSGRAPGSTTRRPSWPARPWPTRSSSRPRSTPARSPS